MSRQLHWKIDESEVFELFESTFGPHDDCSIIDMEFDADLGILDVTLIDEVSDSEYDGHYTGVRIN